MFLMGGMLAGDEAPAICSCVRLVWMCLEACRQGLNCSKVKHAIGKLAPALPLACCLFLTDGRTSAGYVSLAPVMCCGQTVQRACLPPAVIELATVQAHHSRQSARRWEHCLGVILSLLAQRSGAESVADGETV